MGKIFEILELFALQSLFVCTITTLTVFHHKNSLPIDDWHVDIFVFTLTILIRRSEKHLRQCGGSLEVFVCLFAG